MQKQGKISKRKNLRHALIQESSTSGLSPSMLEISPKAINKTVRVKKPVERYEDRAKEKEIDLDNIDKETVLDSQQTTRKEKNSVDNLQTMQIIKAMRLQKKPSAGLNITDKSQLILTVGPSPLDATLKLNSKHISENVIKADAHSIPASATCGTPEGKELAVINEPIVKLEPTL